MKTFRKVTLLAGLLLLLSACQTTNVKDIAIPSGQEPLRTIPVDVQSQYINVQALEPQAIDIASGNLFANGGFENGLDGWTACSAGAIKTSGDTYEGSGALEIIPDNCFYRSAEVSAGDDLILSCYAKVLSGSGWTGMGLGFADTTWTTIDVDVPATVITGTDYARYDVKFTAPTNSRYASMWFYSENSGVVDNCSLMLESEPPPPVPSSGNLLENSEFEITAIDPTSSLALPTEWVSGCNNSVNSTRGRDGRGVNIRFGACIDQSLSAEDIAALSGKDYVYSCYIRTPEVRSGYTSMSIFFDGTSTSVEVLASDNFQRIELRGTAPQATNGFVSIYSEGYAVIDQCTLTVGNTLPSPPPSNGENNLLQYGTFTAFESNNTTKPFGWTAGCNGIYERVDDGRNGSGMRVSGGTCVDQPVNISLLSGRSYTYSCYAKNTGGYASMSIFFDDQPVSTVISQSDDFQLVEITGVAPSAAGSFVSVYAEGALVLDDCSLTISNGNSVPEITYQNRILEVSGDTFDIEGDTMVIGFPDDAIDGINTSKVEIYKKISSGWIMDSEVVLPSATNFTSPNFTSLIDRSFGSIVVIHDGILYIKGLALYDTPTRRETLDTVYIYSKNTSDVWELRQAYYGSLSGVSTRTSFGTSIDVQDNLLLIGANFFRSSPTCSVVNNKYTYTRENRSSTDWQASPLIAPNIQHINGDYGFSTTQSCSGRYPLEVRVYQRIAEDEWNLKQNIAPQDPLETRFGIGITAIQNKLLISGTDKLYLAQSTNNLEQPWEYVGVFTEVVEKNFGFTSQASVLGYSNNRLLLSSGNSEDRSIYVLDTSESSPELWTVVTKLKVEGLADSESYSITGRQLNSASDFGLLIKDRTTNITKRIVTFDIP